jgi:hypothetical protein
VVDVSAAGGVSGQGRRRARPQGGGGSVMRGWLLMMARREEAKSTKVVKFVESNPQKLQFLWI